MSKRIVRFFSILLVTAIFLSMCSAFTPLNAYALDLQKGDVNGDDKISLADALMVLKSVAKIEELPFGRKWFADYDGDSDITFNDARQILLASIDLPPEYLGIEKFTQITPKTSNNGITQKSKFCMVLNDYCETLPASPVDNKSNPSYSPFLEGTYDYVTDGPVKDDSSGHEFYVLKSGKRVYTNDVKVFTGYNMPLNNIEIKNYVESTAAETSFYIKLDWRVPFNVTIKPQSYTKGFNSRVHNLKDGKFTGEYMDLTFYYTTAPIGNVAFPESGVIKSMKWIENTEKQTVTLRIYFRETGKFFGYNICYDENNFLVVSVKEPSQSLSDRVIMIDPGHGGAQPGASSSTGVYERDVTYKISQELARLLQQNGATVLFSRNDAASVPEIEERRLNAYELKPDMFVSIHCDSSSSASSNGSSAYYYKNYSGPLAFAIAENLPLSVKSATGYNMKNGGAHYYPFLVTRIENCPAVLVECGFISNKADFNIINTDKGRKAIAQGIYNGIIEYYGY